jgi:acyl-coenzyme A synthetase/AMP-(fatty) acid ligase
VLFRSIEKCLRSIKNNTALRKIHVVCGASDVTTDLSNKKIAKIISKFADKIILTVLSSIYVSDNNIIIKSFRSTFGKDNNIVSIINRKAAIEYAIKDANHDDVVVILGKGVQNYILEAGKMTAHNDVECVDSIYSDEVSKSTNLVSVLSKKFHEYKEKIAIYHHQNKITFKELDQLSSSYANRLKSLNISQGDNVGVCLERSIEATAILIACIKIGAVYVPLDPQNYELHSMKLIQEHYKPQIIIYSEDFNFKGLENCYSLEFFVNSNFTGTFTHKIKIPEDKPFCILYTSGSTSDPKGVVRTYKAILNQINYFIKIHDENLVLGQVFSLRHVASIIQIFGVFCVGGSIVIIDDDEKKIPEKLIEICNTYKITRLGFSPERYKSFLDKIDEKKLKLNTVKEISCTGDYLSNNIVMKSIQLLPQVELINSYGSTETAGIARQICTKDLSKELVPYPGVKIKILDENNSLLLENETGEIAVSGSSVGYYHNNDTVSFIEISSKIYFKTGDLGYLNDNGNLIILGRNKFTIKVKGRKIFLRDINKNFTSSVLLKGSVVTEVEMGNRNLLVMFYIPSSEENLEGKLKKIAEDFLPLECRPKVYIAIDEIPYLDSGKIDYKTLQKQYLDDIKAQQQ